MRFDPLRLFCFCLKWVIARLSFEHPPEPSCYAQIALRSVPLNASSFQCNVSATRRSDSGARLDRVVAAVAPQRVALVEGGIVGRYILQKRIAKIFAGTQQRAALLESPTQTVCVRPCPGPLIRSAWRQQEGLSYHILTANVTRGGPPQRHRARDRRSLSVGSAGLKDRRLALPASGLPTVSSMDGESSWRGAGWRRSQSVGAPSPPSSAQGELVAGEHGELVKALVSLGHEPWAHEPRSAGPAAVATPGASSAITAPAGGRKAQAESAGPSAAVAARRVMSAALPQAAAAAAAAMHGYVMEDSVGGGAYGEVWRAHVSHEEGGGHFVLKRLFVERGEAVRLSGLREVHFGRALLGAPHVCRFVESFEDKTDLWLVFFDEGFSLQSYLYEAISDGCSLLRFASSSLWKGLRAAPEGQATLRELMRQLLEGVADLHARNVTHRDLKPGTRCGP